MDYSLLIQITAGIYDIFCTSIIFGKKGCFHQFYQQRFQCVYIIFKMGTINGSYGTNYFPIHGHILHSFLLPDTSRILQLLSVCDQGTQPIRQGTGCPSKTGKSPKRWMVYTNKNHVQYIHRTAVLSFICVVMKGNQHLQLKMVLGSIP